MWISRKRMEALENKMNTLEKKIDDHMKRSSIEEVSHRVVEQIQAHVEQRRRQYQHSDRDTE